MRIVKGDEQESSSRKNSKSKKKKKKVQKKMMTAVRGQNQSGNFRVWLMKR